MVAWDNEIPLETFNINELLSVFPQEIDNYIAQAKDNGYETLVRVSRNSLSIAAETMMKTALTVSYY
jgi:hypothetical protein